MLWLYEDNVEENIEEEIEEEKEEKTLYAKHGLSIVVQRNLKVTYEESNEDWLRKNVFHIRCTFQGRVCLVIINSGSFENVVFNEMVQKLGLKTIPHPNIQVMLATKRK